VMRADNTRRTPLNQSEFQPAHSALGGLSRVGGCPRRNGPALRRRAIGSLQTETIAMLGKTKKPPAQYGRGNGNGHARNGNGHGENGGPAMIAWSPKTITGRNLAHGKRTKTQRAFLALEMARGRTVPTHLTLKQSALLAQVNVDYVMRAARLSPAERRAVKFGVRKLWQQNPPAFDETWQQLDASKRQQWARNHAAELLEVLDAVTAPQPQPAAEKTRLRFAEFTDAERADLIEGLGYDPYAEVDPADPLLPEGM
jgi:hypothetical protein